MNWSTIGYVIIVLIVFVLAISFMKATLDVETQEAFGFTMSVLVIAIVSDIIRKRIEYKRKASQNEQARLQADINDLKKNICEMKEYFTDIYIQQDNQSLNRKIEESQ